jgi:hypothetical protein
MKDIESRAVRIPYSTTERVWAIKNWNTKFSILKILKSTSRAMLPLRSL